jgi:hypothetical protein
MPSVRSFAIDAVLMPTTRPVTRLISGPPELPELIGASVCNISGPRREVIAEVMPRVPVKRNPQVDAPRG